MDWAVDILGWCGALLVLVAYALVSTRWLAGDALLYQLLNVAGAALLMANTAYRGAYPSSFVNTIWIGIGAYAIWRRTHAST